MGVRIGRYVEGPEGSDTTEFVSESPALRGHLRRPWLRAFVARELGLRASAPAEGLPAVAAVADWELDRHAFVVGSTGSGKSRLVLSLLFQQLAGGCSALVLAPKGETFDEVLAVAAAKGFPPERMTLFDPRCADGAPGWNPLATGVPLAQAAGDFVALVMANTSSPAPRMQDLLMNALLLAGAHRLSPFELSRILVRDDYREALLRRPAETGDPAAYEEVRCFFRDEFGKFGRSERVQAVNPALNKIRELLRNGFLRSVVTARRNTLDLASLWRESRLVLVYLDPSALGDEGARLLAGLLAHQLLRTALRRPGQVPVALVVDELLLYERLVGGALTDIAAVARSQRLRLMLACQHLGQLSERLRAAMLTQASVQVYFRLGHLEARTVAAALAAGAEPTLARVSVSAERADRRTGLVPVATWRHRIHDPRGRPLRADREWWEQARWEGLSGDPLACLDVVAACSGGRSYVRAADSGEPVEVRQYVRGLPADSYWLEGPELALVVAFPRPKLSAVERSAEADATRRWTRTLQELPGQHAAVQVAGRRPGIVRVDDLEIPAWSAARRKRYLAASRAANGQSGAQVAEAMRVRSAGVERTVAGSGAEVEEEDDGSIC